MSEQNPSTHNHDCGPLDCRFVLDQLWEYLDGELNEETTLLIRQHLALCSSCYPQYDFEKAFLDALADCRCTRCAPHELRGRVVDALRSAGFSSTA